MKTRWISYVFFSFFTSALTAQDNNYGVKGFYPQTFDITDSGSVTVNGLKAGYEIKETDLDSKKDNQSKYKIYFYLRNTGTEAKIMYQNTEFAGHSGPINNNIALFKCLNATGARLTNKMASMELQPCRIMAKVEDKTGDGKTVINTRQVELGYWIRPGETVGKTSPMYVPQHEKPRITVTFYPEVANQTGTFFQANERPADNNTGFAHIKNFAGNTYLNNQNGTLQCTGIENGWWSAEWELIPVAGTDNFLLKNHWKNNFLSTDNGWMTDNGNSLSATWSIRETSTPNVFYIKNAGNNARLYLDNGQLRITSSFISNDNAGKWIIEK